MCDTKSCCDLFYNYVDQVKKHIDTVDTNMYSDLLNSNDEKTSNAAKNFMSGSVEIKKILKDFSKRWCDGKNKNTLKIKDHQAFLKETNQVFDIILQRLLDETEHLYPLVRSIAA